MSIPLEDALLNVWRQSLVENKKTVTLERENFPVQSTAKRKLKQIDFKTGGSNQSDHSFFSQLNAIQRAAIARGIAGEDTQMEKALELARSI